MKLHITQLILGGNNNPNHPVRYKRKEHTIMNNILEIGHVLQTTTKGLIASDTLDITICFLFGRKNWKFITKNFFKRNILGL
jgi:ribosome maturation protein Sdo1